MRGGANGFSVVVPIEIPRHVRENLSHLPQGKSLKQGLQHWLSKLVLQLFSRSQIPCLTGHRESAPRRETERKRHMLETVSGGGVPPAHPGQGDGLRRTLQFGSVSPGVWEETEDCVQLTPE